MFNVCKRPKTFMYCDWNKDMLIDFPLFGLSGKGFEMRGKKPIFFLASGNFSFKTEKLASAFSQWWACPKWQSSYREQGAASSWRHQYSIHISYQKISQGLSYKPSGRGYWIIDKGMKRKKIYMQLIDYMTLLFLWLFKTVLVWSLNKCEFVTV